MLSLDAFDVDLLTLSSDSFNVDLLMLSFDAFLLNFVTLFSSTLISRTVDYGFLLHLFSSIRSKIVQKDHILNATPSEDVAGSGHWNSNFRVRRA
jgi:hypothetical protein